MPQPLSSRFACHLPLTQGGLRVTIALGKRIGVHHSKAQEPKKAPLCKGSCQRQLTEGLFFGFLLNDNPSACLHASTTCTGWASSNNCPRKRIFSTGRELKKAPLCKGSCQRQLTEGLFRKEFNLFYNPSVTLRVPPPTYTGEAKESFPTERELVFANPKAKNSKRLLCVKGAGAVRRLKDCFLDFC